MATTGGKVYDLEERTFLFARRVRALSARLHPDLPFVAYSLLSSIDAVDGCRAVDLAALYRLDKSTVSRQVADLEQRGLVSREPDPAGGRSQVLRKLRRPVRHRVLVRAPDSGPVPPAAEWAEAEPQQCLRRSSRD